MANELEESLSPALDSIRLTAMKDTTEDVLIYRIKSIYTYYKAK